MSWRKREIAALPYLLQDSSHHKPPGDRSLTTTHFAVSVLLGLLLNLDRNEWVVALSFGVLIDADHLFAIRRYVADNGYAAILRPTWDDASGLPWKSAFHYGEGSFIVGYLSIGSRLFYPFIFWGLHITMDDLQLATLKYSTPIESVVFSSAVIGIVSIGYYRWHALQPESGFGDYVGFLGARIRKVFT
jgi:hypothetical protein